MTNRYRLVGRCPVPCNDWLTWSAALSDASARVGFHDFGGFAVSTVFTGLDLAKGKGTPELFETVVSNESHCCIVGRCETWDDAEHMHERGLQLAYRMLLGNGTTNGTSR